MAKVKSPTRPLADVNVLPQDRNKNKIVVCVMPDPQDLVGERESRASIGIDASLSIKKWFGTPGPFVSDPNRMESVVRKLGEVLCGVTRKEEVQLFYWALGTGEETEDIGTLTLKEIAEADVNGPKEHKWGKGTKLLPAIKEVVQGHQGGEVWMMGVILTDGIIEDEDECMEYCMGLGKWLKQNNEDKPEQEQVTIKLVLIGLGDDVNAEQLEGFDDMFEGTDLEDDIDLWSSGLVQNIRDEEDIIGILFGELMSEEQIVAPSGKVFDDKGKVVEQFTDGVPGKFSFLLPKSSKSFTLQVGDKEVVQDLSSVME